MAKRHDRLEAGGATAGAEGIELAYQTVSSHFIKGGNNRVLLATDGDFNVGVSNDNELEAMITQKRESGIFLSCLGLGIGNYKDAKMEMLADKGNGNYNYIDRIEEAEKTLVNEFGGTLFTVAKDVKAQIEFNPAQVQSYRLIGYENRMLNNEDFRNDKKDAGDVGTGHTVTILYECVPAGGVNDVNLLVDSFKYQIRQTLEVHNKELATIKMRYKAPEDKVSKELTHVIGSDITNFDSATENTQFAASVALYGMLLKRSAYHGTGAYSHVIAMAAASRGDDEKGYRGAFIKMVKKTVKIEQRTASK